ncbi:MAG: hypothetical protein ACRDU9_05235 [Acidimicrobiia bacterium]
MTTALWASGNLSTELIGDRWVLVLGGVTRQGNRRARRACARALAAGADVVWFDGFGEIFPHSSRRVPLDHVASEANVFIVEYQETEARTLSGRLRTGAGLQGRRSTRWIWQHLTRRLGMVLRPRAGWLAVRRDVAALEACAAPMAIVYGDDYALTSAWHAGRIWASPPIGIDFEST